MSEKPHASETTPAVSILEPAKLPLTPPAEKSAAPRRSLHDILDIRGDFIAGLRAVKNKTDAA